MNYKINLIFLLGLFIACSALKAQLPSYIPTNRLVGYWTLNSNANDQSGNANNGVLIGTNPCVDRWGYTTRSLEFDGINDKIDFGFNFDLSDAFTISFWLRIDTFITQPTNSNAVILSKFDTITNSGWSFETNGDSLFFTEGCANGCSVNRKDLMGKLQAGVWYHIAIMRNVNGVLTAHFNGNTGILNPSIQPVFSNQTSSLIAGFKNVRFPNSTNYFKGKIDDIAIWDTIISTTVFSDITTNGQCGSSATVQPMSEAYIHGNKIKAAVRNGGDLWWNGQIPQFMTEYDSTISNNPSSIFAGGLWLGAYDGGGNLCLAAQTYRQSGYDYWAGPLDSNANVINDYHCILNKIWTVNNYEILTHIQNYQDSGTLMSYVDPKLLFWPGKNNPHYFTEYGYQLPFNEAFAPFFDFNNDGNYDPFDGDYPVFNSNVPDAIPADMNFTIFNDNGNIHTYTQGNPLKVEIHQTVWSLNCTNENILNSTIFTRHTVISKNNLRLNNLTCSFWYDPDLGCYLDDYNGTSISNKAIYFYNADENDEVICGTDATGYGLKPPVQSVMFLNRQLNSSVYFVNSNDPIRGNPGSALQHYRLMTGKWLDGRAISYGGTGDNGVNAPAYPFVFDGQPTNFGVNSWTMANPVIIGSDYRVLMSTNIDSLLPFERFSVDLAYVTHRDTNLADNIQMTTLVDTELPLVQNWYNQGFPNNCLNVLNSIEENIVERAKSPFVKVIPNPLSTTASIQIEGLENYENLSLEIFNLSGQKLFNTTNNRQNSFEITKNDLAQGIYIFNIIQDKKIIAKGKLVVQ